MFTILVFRRPLGTNNESLRFGTSDAVAPIKMDGFSPVAPLTVAERFADYRNVCTDTAARESSIMVAAQELDRAMARNSAARAAYLEIWGYEWRPLLEAACDLALGSARFERSLTDTIR